MNWASPADFCKRSIVLSRAREGNSHDQQLLDEQGLAAQIPDEIAIEVDLGFQGCQNEDVNIKIPHKKPRSRELSEQQKQEIREQSQSRVKCEHAFAGLRRQKAAMLRAEGIPINKFRGFNKYTFFLAPRVLEKIFFSS
jgi:hypothetical protein